MLHPSPANNERISYYLGTLTEKPSVKTNPATLDRKRAQALEQVARLAA
jgi:hypothetical protein